MIKYITHKDLETTEHLIDENVFFLISEKVGFDKNPNKIHPQRQVQYPYCHHILKLKGNEKILDAGCGYTVWPHFLKHLYPETEIHLLDTNVPRLNRYSDKFLTTEGDITKIPYDDKQFDVIYCISTLEHVVDWEKAIEEFARVLKKDGYLLMIVDGMVTDTHFKEKDVDKMIELLDKLFVVDSINLKEDNKWIYSGIEGTCLSLAVLVKAK
jgi:ubiquinone/menaquinone biosynthesis C-methylase UbiE